MTCAAGSYVFLEDVAYSTIHLNQSYDVGVVLNNTMLILRTISPHIVNTTSGFRQALLDDKGHITEIVVDGMLRIYQWQLGCSIRLERDFLIRGSVESHPPLDLIDFRFSFGCLKLARGNSITFRDLLFNNTMFDSPLTPIEVGWQTLVPLVDLDPGALLNLENVVLDITVDPEADIDSMMLLQFFNDRSLSSMNGYRLPRYNREGMTVTSNWCVLAYIGESPNCFTRDYCNILARCPNGGLYIYSVMYQFPNNPFLQATYSVSDSLFKIERVGLESRISPNGMEESTIEIVESSDGSNDKFPLGLILLLAVLGPLCLITICCGVYQLHMRLKAKKKGRVYDYKGPLQLNKPSPNSLESQIIETTELAESLHSSTQEMQKRAEKLFGKITLGTALGEGAFGKVYKGTWNGAIVAVKVMLNSEEVPTHRKRQEVEREIQVFSKLRHPNIVNLYQSATRKLTRYTTLQGMETTTSGSGSDLHSGVAMECRGCSIETWIVMEYCDKGTLSDAIKHGVFFQDPVALKVNMNWAILTCREIATGFEYLHDNCTIHGDLKPHNILLATSSNDSRQFTAKVTDFGVSRQVVGSHIYTGTVGTMQYTSPEQLEFGKLSEKADIYAFGLIMWQIVSGRSPFKNLGMADVYRKVVVERWRPEFGEGIEERYVALARECWSHVPSNRPSFQEIRVKLEEMENDYIIS
eukprot:g7418.t1